MAFKFTNNNDLTTSISFISSNDFQLGTPVYYKQIGFGDYVLSGSAGSKTATVTSVTGLSDATKSFYFNFSDSNVPSDNYLSVTYSSGTVSVTGVNTSATASGTVTFFDYDLAIQDSNLNVSTDYIITKKVSGTPNTYKGIKIGYIDLPISTWDSLKDYAGSSSGLNPGTIYYLSSLNAGKIVDYKNNSNTQLFKAITKNRAFVDLSYYNLNAIGSDLTIDSFTANGSTSQFTLNNFPRTSSSVIIFINGVFQVPGDSYTITNNIVTFSSNPVNGSKITIQYLKNFIITSFDYYVTRKEYTLSNNNSVSLYSLYGSQESAQYRFFNKSDPFLGGTLIVKDNGVGVEPNVRIDTSSADVTVVKDSANKLNIYIESNLIYFQNKTGSNVSLRIYKET